MKTPAQVTMADFFYETLQKKDIEPCMFIVKAFLDLRC